MGTNLTPTHRRRTGRRPSPGSRKPPRPPRRGLRPSAERWAGATEQLTAVHADLGWIPPSAIEHVAEELGVSARSVRDRLGELERAGARAAGIRLPNSLADVIADCPDFRCALEELGSRLPPHDRIAAEAALWAASDRLVGALKARERVRRSVTVPCPLCPPDGSHPLNGGIRHDHADQP